MNYNRARGKLGYCNLLTRLERPQSASGGEAAQRGPDSLAEESSPERSSNGYCQRNTKITGRCSTVPGFQLKIKDVDTS